MKLFTSLIVGIVSLVVIIGFFVAGSPKDARQRKSDDLRLQHLQMVQAEVVNFWQAKQTLPERLGDLNDPLRGFAAPVDPLTGSDYEYEQKSDTQFILCADFAGASDGVGDGFPKYAPRPAYPDYGGYPLVDGGFNWEHGAGRFCFERTIDPDFFGLKEQKTP